MKGGGHQLAAFVHFVLGKFHNQNGIFCRKANQHDQSDLEVNVVFQTAYRDAEIGTKRSHGK